MERSKSSRKEDLKIWFEDLIAEFNRSSFLMNDPLGIVHEYQKTSDRELVALIAALFAFGNVKCIRQAVRNIVTPLGAHPAATLQNLNTREIKDIFRNNYYRFYSTNDIHQFLTVTKKILADYGTIENAFSSADSDQPIDCITHFRNIALKMLPRNNISRGLRFMFSDPRAGTSKRWHLYLRWMVRKDDIDLGLWKSLKPAHLIQPLDTHIFQIGRELKLISSKSASLKSALEMTHQFQQWSPDDPIRYDFALCQLGIQKLRRNRVSAYLKSKR